MPVHYDYDADLKILCTAFAGKVDLDEVLQVISRFAEENPDLGPVAILNSFSRDSDLSHLSPDDLYRLRDGIRDRLAAHGIFRERTAFVINGSIDILMLGPLWQAINAADLESSFPMRFFGTIDEVPAFLGVELKALRALVARTEAGLQETARRLG
mgnify:CR=1 FL=1|jgi:hypothetical protein